MHWTISGGAGAANFPLMFILPLTRMVALRTKPAAPLAIFVAPLCLDDPPRDAADTEAGLSTSHVAMADLSFSMPVSPVLLFKSTDTRGFTETRTLGSTPTA